MQDNILVILPKSIGGRLTTSSIKDGFIQNHYNVDIFDELTSIDNFNSFDFKNLKYIVGYDFSPIKFKIEHNIDTPVIAYFSDVIENRTSGKGYLYYKKYLRNKDINIFYWDRFLSKKDNWNYMPHFVNTKIYKNFSTPSCDVSFMGRLDTKLRLDTFLNLAKELSDLKFSWYAIEKHYNDALQRCTTEEEKNIIKKSYKGFIDNEEDMAKAINDTKIVYNINAQGISSLNYRTIQVLACERLIISDNRQELDLFNGIIPIYNGFQDLTEKIRFYLSHQEEYSEIVKKSREIILLNHDSKTCIKNILKAIEN